MSKKKFKIILCGCITALCLLLTSCGSLQISQGSGNQDTDRVNQTTTETTFASTGNIESVDTLEEVPEYTGQPYVEINDNEPTFTEDELTADSYEEYSPLDELGRCQTAEACVGEDLSCYSDKHRFFALVLPAVKGMNPIHRGVHIFQH